MSHATTDQVKTILAAFPGVAAVAVTEHHSDDGDHYLIGYVAPDGPGLDTAGLHAHARKALPAPDLPAAIMIVDQIPLAPDGTRDTTALPAPDLDGLLPYRPPATDRQQLLCDLFAEVLGVTRCGLDNDFFDLGGRSVEAMVLAGRIGTALGSRMSMADLFKAPTPADLDSRIDHLTATRK
jgi:acyl carrier protein